jgi:hypothetical protein
MDVWDTRGSIRFERMDSPCRNVKKGKRDNKRKGAELSRDKRLRMVRQESQAICCRTALRQSITRSIISDIVTFFIHAKP